MAKIQLALQDPRTGEITFHVVRTEEEAAQKMLVRGGQIPVLYDAHGKLLSKALTHTPAGFRWPQARHGR